MTEHHHQLLTRAGLSEAEATRITDNGYGKPAVIRPEFLQEVEIIGEAFGGVDPQGRVDLRLADGRIVPNFPADMVERLTVEKEPSWRERLEARSND